MYMISIMISNESHIIVAFACRCSSSEKKDMILYCAGFGSNALILSFSLYFPLVCRPGRRILLYHSVLFLLFTNEVETKSVCFVLFIVSSSSSYSCTLGFFPSFFLAFSIFPHCVKYQILPLHPKKNRVTESELRTTNVRFCETKFNV